MSSGIATPGAWTCRRMAPATAEKAKPDRKSTRLNSSHGYISYAVFCLTPRRPRPPLFPYTTLFRSENDSTGAADEVGQAAMQRQRRAQSHQHEGLDQQAADHEQRDRHTRRLDLQEDGARNGGKGEARSEEHTSELQSRLHLVCRLLLDTAPPETSTLSLHDALPI